MSLLSVGSNKKMGKKVGIFNLPAQHTCPGKTANCSRICYAMKAERCYASARKKRESNLFASKDADFEAKIVSEIRALGLKKIRIHESGDAYNQVYLNKWFRIAAAVPDVKFLMFTKSFHLNWSGKPDNLVVYSSIDTSSKQQPIPGMHTALTLPKGQLKSRSRHVCGPVGKDPVTLKKSPDHYNYCGVECTFCWDDAGNVAWITH